MAEQKMNINITARTGAANAEVDRLSKKIETLNKTMGRVAESSKTAAKQGAHYSKESKRMRLTTEGLRFQLGKLRNTLLLVTFAYQGIKRVIVPAIKAALEQEKQERKLLIALKNTTAGYIGATQELITYAGELQRLTTFGDEQIISAMTMLGTFKLTGEQIKRVIPRILDMTAAMQKMGKGEADIQAISIAVGKAITGNMGVLSRYGVVIDEETMKSKELSKILEALDSNFKGMAEGLRTTSVGALKVFGNAWGDLMEQLGEKMKTDTGFLPVFVKAIVLLTDYLRLNTEREKAENAVSKIISSQMDLSKERYEKEVKAQNWFLNIMNKRLDITLKGLDLTKAEIKIIDHGRISYEEWTKALIEADEEKKRGLVISEAAAKLTGEETKEYKTLTAIAQNLNDLYFNETKINIERRKSVVDYNEKYKETIALIKEWKSASQEGNEDIVEITQWVADRVQQVWGMHLNDMTTRWQDWYKEHTGFVTKQATSLATATHGAWKTFFFDAMTGELKTLEDYFRDFGRSILQILSDVIARLMLAKALGGLSGVWGAAFSGLVPTGGGGGVTDSTVSGIGGATAVAHNGGPIKPRRFANGGGVPIMAESGEGVINREGMRGLGLENLNRINRGEGMSGGGTTNIYNIVAMDALSFQEYLRQNGGAVIEDTMSSAMLNNKSFRNIARQSL